LLFFLFHLFFIIFSYHKDEEGPYEIVENEDLFYLNQGESNCSYNYNEIKKNDNFLSLLDGISINYLIEERIEIERRVFKGRKEGNKFVLLYFIKDCVMVNLNNLNCLKREGEGEKKGRGRGNVIVTNDVVLFVFVEKKKKNEKWRVVKEIRWRDVESIEEGKLVSISFFVIILLFSSI